MPAQTGDGAWVVARFDREVSCEGVASAPLTGIIEPMERAQIDRLHAAGLAVSEERTRQFDVCAFCGRNNARTGLIVCAAFILLGFGVYPLRRAYLSWRASSDAVFREAIAPNHPDPQRAVRTFRRRGLAIMAGGALCIVVGQGWVVFGVVPVRWFGAGAIALGLLLLVFPAQYRSFVSRRRP